MQMSADSWLPSFMEEYQHYVILIIFKRVDLT